MKAEILAVGTELLLGDILNTNAQFLSKELAKLGIDVYFESVVGDNAQRILRAYEIAFGRADLIVVTGGLGPTDDDLTKEVAAKYFNKELDLDENILDGIKDYFAKMCMTMTGNNQKQALVPRGAIVLPNDKGTAPGLIMEENGKILMMLPGPPFEAEHMFTQYAVPYLQDKQEYVFVSRVLRLCGIGESVAEQAIKDMIQAQTNPSIAPYAKMGEMQFRITAKAEDEQKAAEMIAPVADEIYKRLPEYIYAEGDTTLAAKVVELLAEKNVKLALAESCTGGMLAAQLTSIPGASNVFMEGVVTYSNMAKMNRLGVKKETIEQFGEVSEQTASEMAQGLMKIENVDMGISITGIAGPGGATESKPVGLVYIGLNYKGKTKVQKLNLTGDRERIRMRTVIYALDFIRKELLGS